MPADMNSAWMAFQSEALMSIEYVCSVGANRSEQLTPPIPPLPASAATMPPAPVMPPVPPDDGVSTAASTRAPPVPVIPDGPELPQPRVLCIAHAQRTNATL